MRKSRHFFRFLLAGLTTLAISTAPRLQAQDKDPVLSLTFNDGSETIISISDDLRINFDSEHILIQHQTENPRIIHIMDVRKFAYRLDSAGLNTAFTDSGPIVRFAPDGITVTMAGRHTCRAFDLSGSILLHREFDDSLFIENQALHSGTVILQIDQHKTLKFIIR